MTIISMIYIGSFVVMAILFAVLYRLKEPPNIKNLVLEARRDEREKVSSEKDLFWGKEIDKIIQSYKHTVQAEEAKYQHAEESFKLERKKIDMADRAYRDCRTQIDANFSLAAKITLHTRHLEEMIMDFHKKSAGFLDEISQYHEPELGRIEKKYDLDKKLIQIKK